MRSRIMPANADRQGIKRVDRPAGHRFHKPFDTPSTVDESGGPAGRFFSASAKQR